MDFLQQVQTVLGIAASVIFIIGIPLGVYRVYVKEQRGDGDKNNALLVRLQVFETKIEGELKNLGTAVSGELKNLTTEFNFIKLNHLHTIEEKQKDQDTQIGKLTVAVEKQNTIIEERMPRVPLEKK